ncbi:uncharacterized protein PFL1_00651 [Pseudozyma flocculosa PF-1]|uniref:uncharacterized protein n=1 Tax=Pseudozyma flocculosa PF-1 TaxID=1277687 RepID=UPI0004560AB7|nr:uncharacterized protein PFL1_00651 [Pseudozyma flocculosa PF-1]EPQ32455.1 hypothetical protein PFL1_00651 [Pseudozyma flocculosa PF-1]
MPPRKTRASAKAAQPPQTQDPPTMAADTEANPAQAPAEQEVEQQPSSSKSKAKGRASRHQPLVEEQEQDPSAPADPPAETTTAPPDEEEEQSPPAPASLAEPLAASPSASKMSMDERMAKFSSLRKKMADSSKANRKDILSEQAKARSQAGRKGMAQSRKMAEAEKLLEERDLKESGEDVERHRNFGYSIEDNERWEAKLADKEQRKDKGLMDFKDMAERSYQRQIRSMKPDLSSYEAQRAALESQSAGGPASSSSSALTVRSGSGTSGQVVRREDLYRDASTVYYGDHKPTDEAIDRVVGHLNLEQEQIKRRSRIRKDDTDGEVDYINKKNQHFNKKLKRYYDEYTKEIRENFERGTAL